MTNKTTPLQLRIDKKLLLRVRSEARKLSAQTDKDITFRDLIRMTVEEKFPEKGKNE